MSNKLLKTEQEYVDGLLKADESLIYFDLPTVRNFLSSSSKRSIESIVFWNFVGAGLIFYFLTRQWDPMDPWLVFFVIVISFSTNFSMRNWDTIRNKFPNKKFQNLIITDQRIILLNERLEPESVQGSDIGSVFEDFSDGSYVAKIRFKDRSNIYTIARNKSEKVIALVEEYFLSKAQKA